MPKVRDVALFFGGTLISQAVTFLSGVLVARWLGPDHYGVLSLVRNVYGVIAILAPLGLDLSLLRHLGENGDDWPRSIAQVHRFRLIALLVNLAVLGLAAMLVGPWLEHHVYTQPHFALYLSLALLALPFGADIAILSASLRALNQVSLQNLAGLYLQPFVRVGCLALFLGLGLGVGGVVVSTAIGAAAACAAMSAALAWVTRRRAIARHRLRADDHAAMRRVFGYSVWLGVMLLLYNTLRNVDILVLGWFRPPAEVGQYAALSAIAYVITIFPLAVSQTLSPTVARLYAAGDLAGVRGELRGYLRRAVLLSSPIFAGLAAFGPWLDLVFGARYHFSASLSLLLALVYMLSGCLGQMGVSLTMTGRHRLEFCILAVGAAGSLAGCVLLAPRLGADGVALGILFGYVFVNGVRTVLSARVLRGLDIAWSDAFAPLVCLGIAWGWRLLLDHFFVHSWLTAGWAAALLITAFAGLYQGLILRPDEKAFIAGQWRKVGRGRSGTQG